MRIKKVESTRTQSFKEFKKNVENIYSDYRSEMTPKEKLPYGEVPICLNTQK
jgi:hypothetical protein